MVFTLPPQFAHFVEPNAQHARHYFKEAACSRGAFVVHYKVAHGSALGFYYLGILPAYVYQRERIVVKKIVRSPAVAGNLCHFFVRKRNGLPAVARGHDKHILPRKAFLGKLVYKPLRCFHAVPARGHNLFICNGPAFVKRDKLGAGGAHVYTRKIHGFSLSPQFLPICRYYSKPLPHKTAITVKMNSKPLVSVF